MGSRVQPGIVTFSGGEVSPLLAGRTDLDFYGKGCRKLRNMVAITEGAATRRPPTRMVAEVANSTRKTRVRRFEFSSTQAYVIEFGHQTIRFYANKGLIVDGGSNPIVVASPYLETEVAALMFQQSADVLFIWHPSHPPQQLERFSNTDWRLVPLEFTDGPYLPINPDNSLTLAPNALSGTGVQITSGNGPVTMVAPQSFSVTGTGRSGGEGILLGTAIKIPTGTPVSFTTTGTLPFEITVGTTYYWADEEWSGLGTGAISGTPAGAAAGDYIIFGAVDSFTGTVTMTESQVVPANISSATDRATLPSSTVDIPTGTALTLSGTTPAPLVAGTTYYWIRVSATVGKYATTHANALAGTAIDILLPAFAPFVATDVGRFVRLGYIAPDWQASHAYTLGDKVKNGANGVYRCSLAGTSGGSGGPTGTDISIGDGTAAWDFLNPGGIEWGNGTITSFVDAANVLATVNDNFAGTAATYFWRLGFFSDTTGYPATGELHQQRMGMAGCPAIPDRIDLSVSADYGNFTPGVTDSDPISETLGLSGVDGIHWLETKRALFLGTQGSVQKSYGPSGYDSPITPTAFQVVEQVSRGSSALAPVRIINGLIYLHRLERKILELYYDFTQDLDQATELTARARHLTKGGILDMDYQGELYSILWAVRGDGALLGCTYYREQQFLAWHAHTLGGANGSPAVVESVTCIPGGSSDQLWMVVRRTINGVTRRYVEVMDDFNAEEGDDDGFDEIGAVADADLFFGDCYSHYQGSPAAVISGLGYLEGCPVIVLADGAEVTGLTVSGGAITLPRQASNVYVGLDYSQQSLLQPMPIVPQGPSGSTLPDMKKVDKLTVGLYRSGAFLAGPDLDHLDPQSLRTVDDAMDQAPPLFTGAYPLDFDGDQTLEADVMIRPNGCRPLTVLWLVPRTMIEEG